MPESGASGGSRRTRRGAGTPVALAPEALRERLSSGGLSPLYVLLGDDEHEKTALVAAFEAAVDPGLRVFNFERFHGGDGPLGAVLDAARTLPMMAPRRVVVALHAERWLQPKRESRGAIRDLEVLEAYVEAPAAHATLVLVAAGLNEQRRVTRRLLSGAVVVRCGGVATAADAERWVASRLRESGKKIDPGVARVLAAMVGPDVARLRREVERLLLYAAEQPAVTVADVAAVAGPPVAHDDWAVTRAIERGAAGVALREVGLALEAGAVPQMLLGKLAWVARSKLPAARVPAAIDALFRTDGDLKRSAGEPRLLIERLVLELCGAGADRRHAADRGRGQRGRASGRRVYRG